MKDQREQTEPSATAASERPSQPLAPVSFSYIFLLTMFTVGTSSVYHVNQQVLQLTAREFTTNMTVIGFILGLPAFTQLLVTPYVAWKSDRIWTRFGRRRPIAMLMAPILIAATVLAPWCPSLPFFILVVFIHQIAEDADLAITMPSVSDSVPDKQRPLATGIWQLAMALSGIILAVYGLPLMTPGLHKVTLPLVQRLHIQAPYIMVQGSGHWPYTISAVLVAVTSLIYIRVMRERYVPPRPTERFRPFAYGKEMFHLREHRLIWVIAFFQPLFFAVSMAFMSTLGTHGLDLNTGEYGSAYSSFPLVQLLLAIPLGYLFNKFRHRKAFSIAACVYAMIPATFGLYFMKTQQDLAIFFGSQVVAFMVFRMNFMPYLMQYTTPKNVGTILGFSNLMSGVGRAIMMPLMGFLIFASHNNYRIPLYGVYVSAVVIVIALAMMRPPEKIRHLVEEDAEQGSAA
ncbi:MAG: MFS transporter [Armatimonadetes bacterium]|nr:MFS transporter [Armatimonadota bacterium]